MMGRGQFRQFSSLFLIFFSSCATANPGTMSASHLELKIPQLDVRGELSSVEVSPGTVVFVTLHIPEKFKNSPISGHFEGIALPSRRWKIFFRDSPC